MTETTTSRSRLDIYTRRRPFLVIEMFYRPTKGVRTERAGWGSNPDNWDTIEHPLVVDALTPKMMTTATVIIDITKAKIVKNRMTASDAPDEAAKANEATLSHYLDKYRDAVVTGMNRWIDREAASLARDRALTGA